jgi:hypothetical protein
VSAFLLTDRVDVYFVVADADGVLTKTLLSDQEALVSEKNRLTLDRNGKEVVSSVQVILGATVPISYESQVVVKMLNGAAYRLPLKKWQIRSVSSAHLFGQDFTEVWL